MYEMILTIKGEVPSMHCKFPPPKKPGDTTKKLPQTLEEKLWHDKKGVYLPADNMKMMLIGNKSRQGAAEILGSMIESKKGKQYKLFCKAGIWVTGLQDPLKVYYEPLRKTYDDVDIRSFIIKPGSRDTVARPVVNIPWKLTFKALILDDNFPPEKIVRFYEIAGVYCGAGVYGPTFGRFSVKEWEIIKKKKSK